MKAIILTSVFILFCVTGFSQNLRALEDKYGFRGAKLEMPISSFRNLELKRSIDVLDEKTYRVTDADLFMGDYKLKEIEYTFYRGKLMTICITVSNYVDQQGVLKVLEAAYGTSIFEKGDTYEGRYSWKGKKVSMYYFLNDHLSHEGNIYITSEIIFAQRLEDIKMIKIQEEQKILDAAKKL
ncbi:MAG: hypothetical protein MUO72_11080 [Bacteroidales bacterium]|nr:hypothetical protein [Bacteroidales bacterium]